MKGAGKTYEPVTYEGARHGFHAFRRTARPIPGQQEGSR